MTKRTPHQEALDAGMTPAEAARWIAYLAMKARKGEPPIDVHEAVRQIRTARPDTTKEIA